MVEIKVGKTVRLKSGGPLMTVEEILAGEAGEVEASCVWFDKNEAQNMHFKLSSLEVDEGIPVW